MRTFTIFLLAAASALAANSYHTTFLATENPISESGRWIGGSSAGGSLWGDMQTTANLAFGVSEPTEFGDPTAILTGSWGANQTAAAKVRIVNSDVTTGGCCHEVEVRLRMTISAGNISGYEAYCSIMSTNQYCHIARWNGPNGSYCNLENSPPAIHLVDGDILKATITGTSTTVITLYVNGVQQVQATDTGQSCSPGGAGGPFTSGAPGLGVYDNPDNLWSHFGFSDFWATDGVPVLDTTTASSITSSTAASGGTVVDNGLASVTSEGVCYATTSSPTSPCTSDGTSTPFTSSLTSLAAGTLYHYRAFAASGSGTGYGPDLTFTTTSTAAVVSTGSRIRRQE